MKMNDWYELAAMLTSAGKEVVLSTLTLIEAQSELSTLRKLCDNSQYTIEANDMAAVQLLAGNRGFVTGPAVNIYNNRTLAVLVRAGLKRWTLPLELSGATLASLHRARPAGTETEVCIYGRLPLAYSARCFTARAHNLPKDDCQFRCLDYPDGILLHTREDEPFLVFNGIQTQSAKTQNLVDNIDDLVDLELDVLRIYPQSRNTDRIIGIFHDCLQGKTSACDAAVLLHEHALSGECNGYWHGNAGMEQLPRDQRCGN
jgi:collagenase-like PrtC family protease